MKYYRSYKRRSCRQRSQKTKKFAWGGLCLTWGVLGSVAVQNDGNSLVAVDLENSPTNDTDLSDTLRFEASKPKVSASQPHVEHRQNLRQPAPSTDIRKGPSQDSQTSTQARLTSSRGNTATRSTTRLSSPVWMDKPISVSALPTAEPRVSLAFSSNKIAYEPGKSGQTVCF
jgi:hypothetical protein